MSSPRAKRGYRPLAIGETVQAGDMVWFASRWQPVSAFKGSIGKVIQELDYRHCRPLNRPTKGGRSCRVCGCTDADCSGCIERTGQPCHWVGPNLCSACAPMKRGGRT